MDSNSNRNRIPAELHDIEETLRANRHEASPLELDRIKLQAIRQAEQPRPSLYAVKKGTFMKSRLALTLLLVAGFMITYYTIGGLIAVITLAVNIVIILGVMASFGATIRLVAVTPE